MRLDCRKVAVILKAERFAFIATSTTGGLNLQEIHNMGMGQSILAIISLLLDLGDDHQKGTRVK